MFSKTLNAVQQEDQKKKAIVDARTEHMKDQFETAVSKGHLDAATLTMAEKYPDQGLLSYRDHGRQGAR